MATALQRARLVGTQFFYRFGMYVSFRTIYPLSLFNLPYIVTAQPTRFASSLSPPL